MNTSYLVCLIIGTVLAAAYLIVTTISAGRYRALVENLDFEEHYFLAIYPVGFFVIDVLNYKFASAIAQKRRVACEIIYGSLYAEYYLRLNYAQKFSTMLFCVQFGFLLYPVLESPLSFFLAVGAMALAYWNYDMKITDEMSKREDEIARDLPEILSKLTLLVNAGMVLREAWERTSLTGESTLYLEMRNAVMEMQNGVSEAQAIMSFGQRCMSNDVKKFAATLVQNISKGNKELVAFLKKQSSIEWEEKKQYVKQKGEAASSQLTLPVAGMMIGVMIMILAPMIGNMQF